jgi:regulator of nucleoside diphosphate kinase
MAFTPFPERMLTPHDHAQLKRLLARQAASCGDALHALLHDGDVVALDALPPTVVTMGSRVLLQDGAGDAPPYELTLCYPDDARPAEGGISVLSPVGASLLGLQVGQAARWRLPGGRHGTARILAVLFRPEDALEVAA